MSGNKITVSKVDLNIISMIPGILVAYLQRPRFNKGTG